MNNMNVKVIIAAFGVALLLFGCGNSSEAEETITEEISEEVSETEIEEEPEEIEEEAEEVEEDQEEAVEETEAIDEDTMAALKEALDPDVHLLYDDFGDAMLMPTSSITFDEQAAQAISTLYELVYKETLGTYGDEAGIQTVGDNVKVMAGYYYREEISKEEYYEAIFDTEYYDTLLASLVAGTHAADTTGTYYVVPGTDTTGTTGTGTTGTGTTGTDTGTTGTGTTGTGTTGTGTTGTGTTGTGSGNDAAVEASGEQEDDWDVSGFLENNPGGTDGSQYGNEGSNDGLTPENTTIK